MEKVVKLLKEFGLNSYEAKAYVSLLAISRGTATEISGKSGVPPQRIYDSLKGLEDKGFIHSINEKPKVYTPVPVREALLGRIYQLKTEFEKREKFLRKLVGEIEELLPKGDERESFTGVITILGEESIVSKAVNLISEAKEFLWIAGLRPLFKFGCRGNLDRYLNPSVKLTAVGIFDSPCKNEIKKLGGVYIEREVKLPYLLIADGEKAIIVYSNSSALFTENPSVIEPFKVYFESLLR
jgi:predicted transcriptional regulator